jgi:hypothetical protein
MNTGVQFRGNLTPNQTHSWFTFGWNANQHVLWEMVPDTPRAGAPQISWSVAIERYEAAHVTYWITATNLTNQPLQFEGRYAILA